VEGELRVVVDEDLARLRSYERLMGQRYRWQLDSLQGSHLPPGRSGERSRAPRC
jgi:hypothetical protein